MYRKLVPICLALFMTNLFSFPIHTNQTPNITISGQIIDGKSVGVDSVLIYSAFDLSLTAQTNSDGYFELQVPDAIVPAKQGSNIPTAFNISAPFPNPANSGDHRKFNLNKPAAVTVEIYNTLGQRVVVITQNEKQQPGGHEASWDLRGDNGRLVSAGVYFYRITIAQGIPSRGVKQDKASALTGYEDKIFLSIQMTLRSSKLLFD